MTAPDVGQHHTREHAEERRLSGAVRTEHAQHLAACEGQRHVRESERRAPVVSRRDALRFERDIWTSAFRSNLPCIFGESFVTPPCVIKATLGFMDPKPQSSGGEASPADDRPRRIIKRYSNRKLYDTKDSRYVTLLQIAEMVRGGEEVQIIDNNIKQDLTEVTLAQIIYEEQKAHSRTVPLQTLKELIHQRTEKVLSDLREGPIGRLIPGTKDGRRTRRSRKKRRLRAAAAARSLVDQAKETLEDWQHKMDERVKAVAPEPAPWQHLQHEVKRL